MDLHHLETRLAALENKVRRMRLLAAAATCTALAAFLVGGAPPRNKIVEASTFVLIDEQGKERAQLGVSPDGAAALLLRHGDGFTDARLGLLPNGTMALSMRNPRKSASLE